MVVVVMMVGMGMNVVMDIKVVVAVVDVTVTSARPPASPGHTPHSYLLPGLRASQQHLVSPVTP